LFRSLSSAPAPVEKPTAVAFQASHLISIYVQVVAEALCKTSDGEVPVATLIKLLEPFSLIEPTMPVIQLAFKYIQAWVRTWGPGSDEVLTHIKLFHGALHNMFILLQKLIQISTAIRQSPALKSKLAKLEAKGTSYVNKDVLWELMDKCIYLLANPKPYDHTVKYSNPYVAATMAIGDFLILNKDYENDGFMGDRVINLKRSLRSFHSIDYDECYVKAFEYFADDAGNDKSFPKEMYNNVCLDLTKFVFLHH